MPFPTHPAFSTRRWKPTPEQILFGVLLVAYLTPLWVFPYIPSEDGPPHLGNAYIIKVYNEPASVRIREYYRIDYRQPTNVAYHFALAALMYVFPPLVAEKVMVSGLVVLLAVAFRRLVIAVHGRADPAALLVFPFIVGRPFAMGFYGWVLSLGIAVAGLAYYWHRRDNLNAPKVLVLNLFALAAFWAHLLGWAVYLGGLVYLAYGDAALAAWKNRRAGTAVANRPHLLRQRFALPLYLAPALALGAFYFLAQPTLGEVTRNDPTWLVDKILFCCVVVSYNNFQWFIAVGIAAALWTGVIAAVTARILASRRRDAVGPRWSTPDALWGGATLLTVALYFLLPESTPFRGSWINIRFLTVPFLAALIFIAGAGVRWFRRATYVAAPALAVAFLVGVYMGYAVGNQHLRAFMAGKWVVTSNATILPYVDIGYPVAESRINYTKHAAALYTLGTRAVNLGNYEPEYVYFPVKWRPGKRPLYNNPLQELRDRPAEVDYLLLWRIDTKVRKLGPLLRPFELVHYKDGLRGLAVWRRRGLAPINRTAFTDRPPPTRPVR